MAVDPQYMSLCQQFSVGVAVELGVNAAILLNNLKWWCLKNRSNGTNYHDGLYWTYNTVEALAKMHPYMTESAVRTALAKLLEAGYIVKGRFNKVGYDRTLWYAVTDLGFAISGSSIFEKSQMEVREISDRSSEISRPIPVGITVDNPVEKTVEDTAESVASDAPSPKSGRQRKAFVKPTPAEVDAYIRERGYTGFDGEGFCAYYESVGWKVGRNPMKDWKSACTTWSRRRGGTTQQKPDDFAEFSFGRKAAR